MDGMRVGVSILCVAGVLGLAASPATALECNQKTLGSIDVAGEVDVYTFDAVAGERVSFFTAPRAANASSVSFWLYAPDGSQIVDTFAPLLPQTGTYQVEVWLNPFETATGEYELSLVGSRLGGTTCTPWPARIRCGESVSVPREYRSWTFLTFVAAQRDVVTLTGPAGPSVVAPDGSRPTAASFVVPRSGAHTVGVFGESIAPPPPFYLTLQTTSGSINGGSDLPPTPVCGIVPDGTRTIGCGETKTGAIDVPGDRDLYAFFAKQGDQVHVQIAPQGGGSPFWAFARLVSGDGAGVTHSPVHELTEAIPTSGGYAIEVTGAHGQDSGGYAVTLTRTPCASACNDGVDNDGDGLVDLAEDGGCTSADDLNERNECNDARDNDRDEKTDYGQRDPGCFNAFGATEDPACDDGADNDGDGTIDADGGGLSAPDAFCGGQASNNTEAPLPAPGCGLGPELALLIPALAALRRWRPV
jgi:hypothetical protein